MKIVVIGGTGLIGSKVVAILRQAGQERSLVPLGDARLGRIGFAEWLRRSRAAA